MDNKNILQTSQQYVDGFKTHSPVECYSNTQQDPLPLYISMQQVEYNLHNIKLLREVQLSNTSINTTKPSLSSELHTLPEGRCLLNAEFGQPIKPASQSPSEPARPTASNYDPALTISSSISIQRNTNDIR